MADTLELTDFLNFFEAEPEVLDTEVGWSCGARFVSVRGPDRIEAVIAPDDASFKFRWRQNGTLRADLNLEGIVGWKLESTSQHETLSLSFHQSGIALFRLQLKPAICISWVTQ